MIGLRKALFLEMLEAELLFFVDRINTMRICP